MEPGMVTEDTETPVQYLLRLVRGFQVSQLIYAAVRLGILPYLRDRTMSSAELAELTQTHAPSLYRLLRVLAAFEIVSEPEPNRFALTRLGQPLLSDSSDSIHDAVLLLAGDHFIQSWASLSDSLRTGATSFSHVFGEQNPFTYYARHPDVEAIVNGAMAALSRWSAAAITEALPLETVTTIVDVGGGRGVLISKILQSNPRLRGILFDLPHVVRAAGPVLAAAGVADRCSLVEGDMFQTIPAVGDAYLFSRVVHDWSDDQAIALLKVCRRSMPDGARVLLIERVLPDLSTPTRQNQSLFLSDLTMLVRTGGRERTHKEFELLLSHAGLCLKTVSPTDGEFSILEAFPFHNSAAYQQWA
jgi:hypothetical protein